MTAYESLTARQVEHMADDLAALVMASGLDPDPANAAGALRWMSSGADDLRAAVARAPNQVGGWDLAGFGVAYHPRPLRRRPLIALSSVGQHEWSSALVVVYLVVVPDRQGEGVGSRLLARLTGDGSEKVVLETWFSSAAVEFFYKSRGFEILTSYPVVDSASSKLACAMGRG